MIEAYLFLLIVLCVLSILISCLCLWATIAIEDSIRDDIRRFMVNLYGDNRKYGEKPEFEQIQELLKSRGKK